MPGVRCGEVPVCPDYDSVKNSTQCGGCTFMAVLSRVLLCAGLRSSLIDREGCGSVVPPVLDHSQDGHTTTTPGDPFLRPSLL